MMENILCACTHAVVREHQNIVLDDISLKIGRKQLTALISEDDSAAKLLRLMAGLLLPEEGEVSYPDMTRQETACFPKKLQYVPDDIVCYAGLTAEEFLGGMTGGREELRGEAQRLVSLFGLDVSESLLEMTFEQNRLVSIIQAMMAEPSLLLLDRPYDMLNQSTYKMLLREVAALYAKGSGIVLTSGSYKEVVLPCHRYVFLRDGKIIGDYQKNQLPAPAKVITLWGGKLSAMVPDKMEILCRNRNYTRFLYREKNMQELALRIGLSECRDFVVEELSMEEELFGNYEGWLS